MGEQRFPPNERCPCGSRVTFEDCCGALGLDRSELRAINVEAMKTASVSPAHIYAYERTGLIVTTENRGVVSAADLDEWDDAVAEYQELNLRN